MAETKKTTPSANEEEASVFSDTPESAGEPNLDDIDKVLQEQDPEFLSKVGDISGLHDKGEDVHLDFSQEKNHFKRFYKKLSYLVVGWSRWFLFLVTDGVMYLVTDGRKKLFEKVQAILGFVFGKISAFFYWHSEQNWLRRISFWAIVGLFISAGAVSWLAYQGKFINETIEPYLSSLESIADQVYFYDPEKPAESFYNSMRMNQNTVLLDKVIVSLNRGHQPNTQPMGVFELFAECSNQEVAVEIKNRMLEVKDLTLRVLEGFTYKTLDSEAGKELMRLRLRQEINVILYEGQVRRIMIKNMIIKP